MSKKKKPGALFFFDDWNTVIATASYEEIGKLTHCALLYAQGLDNTDVLNSLCPELQGIWIFIAKGLDRTGISYREKIVRTAWGGYKKNHESSKEAELGSKEFIEFYVNSSYYDERLFQNADWYDSVLEYANSNNNSNPKDSSLTEKEDISENVEEDISENEKRVRKGFRGNRIPSASDTQIIRDTSPEALGEILKRSAEQKGIIS